MSLRPMLYATNVKPLLAAASSRDLSLVERIVDWFRNNLPDPKPDTLDMARRETERLLSGAQAGRPESEDHVGIVSALAQLLGVQNHEAMIADGDWKWLAWDDYFEEAGPLLSTSAREQFGQLAHGERPLFGSAIESGWSYYGYLLNNEVQQLLAALEQAAADHPKIASTEFIDGFHNELVGWLHQVEERKTDLWLFAY